MLSASAAAGTPAQGVSGGAPDGSPASTEVTADTATTTTPVENEPITSAAPPPSTSEAAKDNQPVADEENEPQAQDAAPDPAPVLEASNDNPPPPSAEAI